MRSQIAAGAIAGLAAGTVAAALLSVMAISSPEGGLMWVITLVAQTVRSDSFVVAWLIQLVAGTVIGAIFGGLFACFPADPSSASGLGAIYGIVWWVVGWLVVMPLALGLSPLAPVTTPSRLQVAIAGLLAHLGYGAVLGGIFAWLIDPPSSRSTR